MTHANAPRTAALMLVLLAVATPAVVAGFVVDDFGDGSDADLNDGSCATSTATCTLRAAIEQANENAGLDIVEFAASGTVLPSSLIIDITDDLIVRPGPAPAVTISSANQGLVLRVLGTGTSVTFEDLTFANPHGKAISVGAGPQVTIRRCIFDGNTGGLGTSTNGGALSVGGETIVESSEFRNNTAKNGGAIHLGTNALLTIRDTVIEDNTATTGAGIAVGGGTERLVLENTVLQRNIASGDGGGIHSQSRVEAEGLSLYDNEAGGDGGGIWARNFNGGNTIDALRLVGADVRGNTATGKGGGLFLDTGEGLHDFLVDRSAIWENDAADGGGVYLDGSTTTVYRFVNTTIGLNDSPLTGGLRAVGDVELLHVTIWDNQNEQIWTYPVGANTKLGNSIVGFARIDGSGCDPAPTQLGPNLASDASCGASIVDDPELDAIQSVGGVAPAQPFADTSPANDAADATLCADPPVSLQDVRGPYRPVGKGCDLGPWERGGPLFADGFESGDTSRWN